MKTETTLAEIEKLYEHLMAAYDIAGGLRDSFSGVGGHEGKLKDYCNTIRGNIYELRELRGPFVHRVKSPILQTDES